MTDSAGRLRGVPSGTFVSDEFRDEPNGTGDTVPDVPLRSYIDQLRHRVDTLPEDEGALTVPPNATFKPWVAGDLQAALEAAAEIVPRTPSSPDDQRPLAAVPAPELPGRHQRRKREESVPDFPVELREHEAPILRTRDRGRASGRFVLPAALRAPSSDEGPIARALKELVQAEREAEGAAALADDTVRQLVTADGETDVVTLGSVERSAPRNVLLRALLVFVVASVAGAASVYVLLNG